MNLPGQELCTIVSATGVSLAKLVAVNTFLLELAMSLSCVRLTFLPIPREYTITSLFLSGREATESSVYEPLSVVCSPSVITIAICKKN